MDTYCRYDTNYKKVRQNQEEVYLTYRELAVRGGFAERVPKLVAPIGFSHLVDCFWRLRGMCPSGEFESPITPRLLLDFQELEGLCLSPLERSIILEMDAAFRGGMAKQRAKVQKMESG